MRVAKKYEGMSKKETADEREREGGSSMDLLSRSASFSDFPRDGTGRLRHPYPP